MIYIIIIAACVALDQLSKYLVQTKLQELGSVPIIENVFHLTYARNTGAAFSILRDKQLLLILFTFIAIAMLIGLLLKNIKLSGNLVVNYSLVFIIGGAIGNLIDRMRLNYVIDFFDFRLINFAIFNVADMFVVFGAVLLGFAVLVLKAEIY
ncbi:MAG: signal peptidase II [Acidaminobacteraceae bacterium]